MPYLTVIDGPDVGTSFEITTQHKVLGRESSVDIHLNSLLVSRRHARVWERGGQFFLQDLDSQNGTFVNGLPIDLHALAMGDEIVLGEVVLSFTDSLDAVPAAQSSSTSPDELAEFSLTDTIQSSPEKGGPFSEPEQRWKRLPLDLRGLAIVNEAARLSSTATSMEQFLGKLMDLVMAATKAHRGALLLINPRSNSLSVRVIRTPSGEDSSEAPFSKTIIRYVLKKGIGILSQDPTQDERFGSSRSIAELGLRSTLCVPMRFRNRILGVIHMDSSQEQTFEQKHLLLVSALASQAALFIENIRVLESQRRSNLAFRRSLQVDSLVIGKSRRMQEIVDMIRLVSPTDSTVLLRGESGTGKEVIARTIHRQSRRKEKPLVVVNCAALSPTVLESELFGHEQGAFTGAVQRRLGRFELAHGGTIFLDEISELPLELQAKLLRVLQEQEFERVGGQETLKVDVRILSSTNRDLQAAIRKGTFREDLYFRLKVIELVLPPLRERSEDVPLLVQHFLQTCAAEMGRPAPKLAPGALETLVNYSWPGNIRELKNLIERAVVLARKETITPLDLPLPGSLEPFPAGEEALSLQAAEQHQIRKVLRLSEWNKTQAAKLLGISRARLDRKIRDYGISKSSMFKEE